MIRMHWIALALQGIFIAIIVATSTANADTFLRPVQGSRRLATSSDPQFQAETSVNRRVRVFSSRNATHVDLKIEYTGSGYVAFGPGNRMVGSHVMLGVDVANNAGFNPVGLYRLVSKSGSAGQLVAAPNQLAGFGVLGASFSIVSDVSTLRFSVLIADQKPEFPLVPSSGSVDVIWAVGGRRFVEHSSEGIRRSFVYGGDDVGAGADSPGRGTKSADPNFAFDSQLDPRLVVSYKVNNTHASYKLKLTGVGYVAIGTGSSMIGATALVGMDPAQNPGYQAVGLYKLNSKVGNNAQIMSLIADSEDALKQFGIVETSYAVVGSDSELRFTVELANQQADYTLVANGDAATDIIYASGGAQFSLHGVFGSAQINFIDGGGGAAGFVIPSSLSAHIVFMIMAWELAAPFGILAPMLNNAKYNVPPSWGWAGPEWFKAHWVALTACVFFGYIGTLTGFLFVDSRGSAHWSTPHKNLGLVVLLGSIAQPIWGRLRPPKTKTGEEQTQARVLFERGHPLLGYLLLLLGMVNCLVGVQELERVAGGQRYVMGPFTSNTGYSGAMAVMIILLFLSISLSVVYGFIRIATLGSAGNAAMIAKKLSDSDSGPGNNNRTLPVLTWGDIVSHNNETSCYVVYDGKVLDVTGFLQSHPGGKRILLQHAGQDITTAFRDIGHSASAVGMMTRYAIGRLAGTTESVAASNSSFASLPMTVSVRQDPGWSGDARGSGNVLLVGGNQVKHTLRLVEKIPITHNVYMIKLGLPSPMMVLGLPKGKHICITAPAPRPKRSGMWNNKPDLEAGRPEISRKYTPISNDEDDVGYFTLVVKSYRPDPKAGYPDGGKMSRFLDSLKVGDSVIVSGPFGTHEYLGGGVFMNNGRRMNARNIAMIAGGSGITPMFQLADAMLRDNDDPCRIRLFYANSTIDDVLLKNELDRLQQKYPRRIQIWYTISQPPNRDWNYSIGRISAQIVERFLPPPNAETLVLCCGPKPMLESLRDILYHLGYSRDQCIEY